METKNGKKGGLLKGKSHKQGGIKAIITDSNNAPIEVEGGEVIINKISANSNKQYEFEGQKMTPKEILSKINQDGGGVPVFEKGGDMPRAKRGCPCFFKGGGQIENIRNTYDFTINGLEINSNDIYDKIQSDKIDYEIKTIDVFNPKIIIKKIDTDFAIKLKNDYKKPIGIIYEVKDGSQYLIDGNHRMYKAWLDGVKYVKVYVIKEKKYLNNKNKMLYLQNKNNNSMKTKRVHIKRHIAKNSNVTFAKSSLK